MSEKPRSHRAERRPLDAAIRDKARPWEDRSSPDRIAQAIGDARVILLGEATHGTREFYQVRASITRRLIERGLCDAVLFEADWPDAYRVNRYVQGRSRDRSGVEALGDFRRFPQWMWRNREVVAFIEWLRAFNGGRPEATRVGVYGMDLYSMYTSIDAVVQYLDRVDPAAARLARTRYGCFERFDDDPQAYALEAGERGGCEEQAMNQLLHLLARRADYEQRDGLVAEDEQFHAEQNARLVASAERYYRAMFAGRSASWNLRDQHMADSVLAMENHLRGRVAQPRVAVWAHNSHVGDARATEMAAREEINLGQLMRERVPGGVFSVGFSTERGWVTAADDWDEPAARMRVVPALRESFEALLHGAGQPAFLLDLQDESLRPLLGEYLERAIGVVYRPATERQSHYLWARPAEQFDMIVHIDRTTAVEPLEPGAMWHVPAAEQETFPTGI